MGGGTAFLMHPASALHDTGWGHPEHQGRLRALARAVDRALPTLHERVDQVEAVAADPADALLVHSQELLASIRAAVDRAAEGGGIVALDPDTRVSGASWDAAMGALGAAIGAAGSVAEGAVRNAFVATRPPGHHATPDRAMGFCLVNHVACAARWLQTKGLAERILIVDWDVHHGNGTQDTFWADPSVFYLSLHQSPHFPGTGRESERGGGEGEGHTRNVEIRAGTARRAYLDRFRGALEETLAAFSPDLVLVSSGFDCLAGDPLGGLLLEPTDLYSMTRMLVERVEEPPCHGRIVVCLEGGYDPERTGRGSVEVLRALVGLPSGGT